METFLNLNKIKIRRYFLSIFGFLLTLVLIYLIYTNITNQFPENDILLIMFFSLGVGLPTMVILYLYLIWLGNTTLIRNAFNQKPFNQLEEIGFSIIRINESSKWLLTRETKSVIINNYQIICNINEITNGILEFKALTKWKQIDEQKYEELKSGF